MQNGARKQHVCGPLVIQVLITKVSSQISSSSHWVSIGSTDLRMGLVALQICTRGKRGIVQLSFDKMFRPWMLARLHCAAGARLRCRIGRKSRTCPILRESEHRMRGLHLILQPGLARCLALMVCLNASKSLLRLQVEQAKHDELGFFDLEDRPSVLVSSDGSPRQTRLQDLPTPLADFTAPALESLREKRRRPADAP